MGRGGSSAGSVHGFVLSIATYTPNSRFVSIFLSMLDIKRSTSRRKTLGKHADSYAGSREDHFQVSIVHRELDRVLLASVFYFSRYAVDCSAITHELCAEPTHLRIRDAGLQEGNRRDLKTIQRTLLAPPCIFRRFASSSTLALIRATLVLTIPVICDPLSRPSSSAV